MGSPVRGVLPYKQSSYVMVILTVTGVRFPTDAVTVAAPAVAPAENDIVATPCAFVTLVADASVPVPVGA